MNKLKSLWVASSPWQKFGLFVFFSLVAFYFLFAIASLLSNYLIALNENFNGFSCWHFDVNDECTFGQYFFNSIFTSPGYISLISSGNAIHPILFFKGLFLTNWISNWVDIPVGISIILATFFIWSLPMIIACLIFKASKI